MGLHDRNMTIMSNNPIPMSALVLASGTGAVDAASTPFDASSLSPAERIVEKNDFSKLSGPAAIKATNDDWEVAALGVPAPKALKAMLSAALTCALDPAGSTQPAGL